MRPLATGIGPGRQPPTSRTGSTAWASRHRLRRRSARPRPATRRGPRCPPGTSSARGRRLRRQTTPPSRCRARTPARPDRVARRARPRLERARSPRRVPRGGRRSRRRQRVELERTLKEIPRDEACADRGGPGGRRRPLYRRGRARPAAQWRCVTQVMARFQALAGHLRRPADQADPCQFEPEIPGTRSVIVVPIRP